MKRKPKPKDPARILLEARVRARQVAFAKALRTIFCGEDYSDPQTRLPPEVMQHINNQVRMAGRTRVICGAKTRAGGSCKAKSVRGKQRCRMHGGLSTGPRTEEGRRRVAEAARARWARFRAERLTGTTDRTSDGE